MLALVLLPGRVVSKKAGVYVLRRLGFSTIVGTVVFASLSPPIWGQYVSAFVTSAIAGGIIGCVGGGIGELAYGLIAHFGESDRSFRF